jgi:glutathione-regulated potassium-efflux system ancillary protein KefC
LRAAKTGEAKLFVVCVDDVDASLAIVAMVKKHFPDVKILARARNRSHYLELRDMGIESPIRETFSGSVDLARLVLGDLGEDEDRIAKTIETFVAHDLDMLERAQAVFRDEDKLIALAKTSRAELSNILSEDAAADGRSDRLAPELESKKA